MPSMEYFTSVNGVQDILI